MGFCGHVQNKGRKRGWGEGGAGAKMWMNWVQSKFVIVKHMRFGEGVNTEFADLWTSTSVCVTATVLTINPQSQTLCNKKSGTFYAGFLCGTSALPDPSPCPNYRCTICLSISFHFWAASEPVLLKLPLGPGDLPACSLQWPQPRKHSDWSINN